MMTSHDRSQSFAGAEGADRRAAAEPADQGSPKRDAGKAGAPPADEAARTVMHPELHDPDWRYYHGAWGG